MSENEVKVLVQADTSDLQSGVEQASESAEQLSEKLQGIKSAADVGAEGLDKAAESAGAFASAISSMAEIAGGVLAGLQLDKLVGDFESFFKSATIGSFEWGESLTNLSTATGMTTDQLQIVERAAQVSGSSFSSLGMIVNRVSRVMLEFSSGSASKQMLAAANALKIDPTQYSTAFDLLEAIEDRIKSIGTLTLAQRGALEQLFGRGVLASLPFIEKLRETEDEMRKNGDILSGTMVKAQDEAAQSINKLTAKWDEFKHTIGGGIAEDALASLERFKNIWAEIPFGSTGGAAEATGGMLGTGMGGPAAESLEPAVEAQQKLTAAVQKTSTATESLKDVTKDWSDTAKNTLDQILPKVIAYDTAWQDTYHDLDMAATVEAHLKEKGEELQAAVDAQKQSLKDYSEEIASVFDPVGNAFGASFDAIIAGTQSVTLAFQHMAQSIILEMAKGGIHDLLVGGKANTLGGSIFGISGAGGGLAGTIASAFQGSAISTALKTSLTSAWSNLTAPISTVFGNAFRGIEGIINSVFGTALGSAGGGAGTALSAAAGASETSLLTTMEGTLSLILGTLVSANITLESILATDIAIFAKPSAFGFSFASGGIVPGPRSLGIPAIVHGGEGILPASSTTMLMNAAGQGSRSGGGSGDSGGNVIVNFTANGVLASDLRQHADTIGDIVAQKVRDARFSGGSSGRRSRDGRLTSR